MALINCESLAIGYRDKQLIENLTFCINSGNYLCILGENGSGKSTLMRTLLGLRKPISGTITFGDGLKNTEIGYLPQQTAAQRDFPASVQEVVFSGLLGGSRLPFYSAEQKERALRNMELLSILPLANRCYRELSGGQQQRVLLARALCASSKLILLDEPVAGLDPLITAEMYSIIAELNRSGMAVIMISHDVDAALKDATHVLHIARRPKFFGPASEYLTSDAWRATGGRRS